MGRGSVQQGQLTALNGWESGCGLHVKTFDMGDIRTALFSLCDKVLPLSIVPLVAHLATVLSLVLQSIFGGALIDVLQRVRPLNGQLGGVHHRQVTLLRVQPRLVTGGVLLFPRWVVLARLVHTSQHLWRGSDTLKRPTPQNYTSI